MNKRWSLGRLYFTKMMFVIVLSFFGVLLVLNEIAFSIEGGGGNTGGTDANCSNNAYLYLCGSNGSEGGGASWRIFKTDNGWGLDDWTGYGGDILQAGYKGQAMRECGRTGWFASFGWDGMYGSNYGYSNFNFQIGPANRNGLIAWASYNNYGAKNYEQIKNNYSNNTKITEGAALALYREAGHPNVASIPNGVGYFCVEDSYVLTLQSINADGSSLSSVIPNRDSGKVNAGDRATVERGVADGYTFLGFASSVDNGKTGNYVTSTNTNSDVYVSDSNTKINIKSIGSNATMYAVYIRNEFKARARVGSGTDWSNVAYGQSSGWVTEGNAPTSEIECADNSGCTAGFWFDLKTIHGSGMTTYVVQRKNTNGTWSNATIGSIITNTLAPATSNNTTDGERVYFGSLKLGIDSTACFRIKYKPFGSLDNTTEKVVGACAHIKPSTFEGKTTLINGSTTTNAGWTANGNVSEQNAIIPQCSATSGCKVSFRHYLKRTSGIASTTYYVTRSSNLTNATKGVSAGTIKSETTFNQSGEQLVSQSKNVVLYPGMVVCETLFFKPNNKSGTSYTHTKICVKAEGKSQPDDPGDPDTPEDPNEPSQDDSFINIKVRNKNVNAYNRFQREVYAKPFQTVEYRATYNPVLQYTYYLKPEKMQIDGGVLRPEGTIVNTTTALGSLFNTYNSSNMGNWNNGISIYSRNRDDSVEKYRRDYYYVSTNPHINSKYRPGDFTKKVETNERIVSGDDVGINSINLDEIVRTNYSNNTKTTPRQVSFGVSSNLNKANVNTGSLQKTARVRVPYNFILVPELNVPDKKIVSAGEAISVGYTVNVEPRENAVTTNNKETEAYATVVEESISKLIVYYPSGSSPAEVEAKTNYGNGRNAQLCEELYGLPADDQKCGYVTTEYKGGDKRLNSNSNTTGETKTENKTFYAKDEKAGSKVCFAVATYPSSSGVDTNWNNIEGSGKWNVTKSRCIEISKKPSIQIWGGNVYSAIGIETNVAVKNDLAGYTNYSISNGSGGGSHIFGSFGELAVISRGNVEGFASGAGTGYRLQSINELNNQYGVWPNTSPANGEGNNNNILSSPPGGSLEPRVDFCNRVRLSFSNDNCESSVSGIGDGTNTESNQQNKISIINKLIPGGESTIDNYEFTINAETKKYAYSKDKNITIQGGEVSNGIKAIHSDNVITITGDITYTGNYASVYDVPKIVIYGKKEIRIGCNVNRIDALLITDGKVITCYDPNDNDNIEEHINEQKNSRQLVINGGIIAANIIANRTYGAATGANSIIPAEIINFDPTLYMWGGAETRSETSNVDLTTTYLHELSPRY